CAAARPRAGPSRPRGGWPRPAGRHAAGPAATARRGRRRHGPWSRRSPTGARPGRARRDGRRGGRRPARSPPAGPPAVPARRRATAPDRPAARTGGRAGALRPGHRRPGREPRPWPAPGWPPPAGGTCRGRSSATLLAGFAKLATQLGDLLPPLGEPGLGLGLLRAGPGQVGVGGHPQGQGLGLALVGAAARGAQGLGLDQPLAGGFDQVGGVLVGERVLGLQHGPFGLLDRGQQGLRLGRDRQPESAYQAVQALAEVCEARIVHRGMSRPHGRGHCRKPRASMQMEARAPYRIGDRHLMDIGYFLKLMTEKNASDMFLTTGAPVYIKIEGKLYPLGNTGLPPGMVKKIAYSLMDEGQVPQFERDLELNMAIAVNDAGRFRVNVFKQRGEVGMVIRAIRSTIPSIEELNLPEVLKDIIMTPRGLVLIVGSTGSGKST